MIPRPPRSTPLSLHDALPILKYGGFSNLPQLFWVKMVFVASLTLASIEATNTILDRKSTRLNSSHVEISYAVFCLKKKKKIIISHSESLDIAYNIQSPPLASA